MDNGVGMGNGEHPKRETDLAAGSGDLRLESVNGAGKESPAESNGLASDSEENEVFEEAAAAEQESFYTPAYRHMVSDSQGLGGRAFDAAVSSCGSEDDLKVSVVEEIDLQIADRKAEEQEAVVSGAESEAFDGSEVLEMKLSGTEADGPTEEGALAVADNGEKFLENGHKELTEENPQNGEYNGLVLDEGPNPFSDEVEDGISLTSISSEAGVDTVMKPEERTPVGEMGRNEEIRNGASVVSTSDEMALDSVTESKAEALTDEMSVDAGSGSTERTPVEGVDQMDNDLVGLGCSSEEVGFDTAAKSMDQALCDKMAVDTGSGSKELNPNPKVSPDDGLTRNMQLEAVNPQSAVSATTNEIMARSCASVDMEGDSEKKQEHAKAKESNSDSKSEGRRKFDRESVLVENSSESSSREDHGERSNQPALLGSATATVRAESSGGLSLPSRPAGLGSSASLLEPPLRSIQQPKANGVAQRQSQLAEEPNNDDPEENDETREKLQMIRVKFLRLAHRLGQTPHNVVVAQVLYRLGLAEQLRSNTNRPNVSFDRASIMAEQLEASGKEPLDFSCTIMVIGKTGVGKSATINSIFNEVKFRTDAFQEATKKVQDNVGTVQGIKVRIIDTPGLLPSSSDQWRNEKILRSVKKFIGQSPPDIVLYFDRLDMQCRDYGDVPLLRSITNVFGSSIWFNAIIVLTHAASAPPDGPHGTPLSYEMFVSQRSHVVQQAIRQAAQDLRLMNPVSLVENHSACRTNRAGQRVLPNGQVWRPHLLLLSFASKILAEANMLLQLQDSPPGRPFEARARAPPLPFFLSSLLQSRPQLKLPEEQLGDDFTGNEELDEASDSDDGSEYDELPPFRTLNNSELAKLSKAQKKAYFEELDYREKLLLRKQLKEDKMRRKLMKKMAEEAKDNPKDYDAENIEDENPGPASVPVPMPDLALPTSFDSDNPTHRYRCLDTSNQWVVRPVLETQVWDHDVGYDGLNVERLFAIKDKIPLSVSGQLTKDKKECTFQLELASSIKHGDAGATSLGLDMQTIGRDMAYTLRSETRIKNFRRNSTAAGISVTHLGDAVSGGVKIEDNLVISKRTRLLMSGGLMAGRGDIAYGGRLEATLRDKDYPFGRALSTFALSVVDWHGDLAFGYNLQSQIPVDRGTNLIGHANVNNKGTGQVGIRLNSSDHLQIALFALLPIFRQVKRMLVGSSQQYD